MKKLAEDLKNDNQEETQVIKEEGTNRAEKGE